MHQSPFRSKRAFTLIELLLVVAIMMILTTLMLPVIVKTKGRSHQLECLNQLRSTGMGFISYAHDHADRFPFQVSTKEGGTLELLKSANPKNEGDVYFAFRHFQSLSNEVAEVKILRCPVDFRTAAPSFQELKNENVSYFLAVTADPARADSLLAGDRNISETDGQSGSIVKMTAMSSPRWTRAGHEFKGNLLFAGGHVERTGNAGLSAALRSPTGPISVWMPVASPTPAASASSGQGSAGGGNADSDRGFSMLQNFFQTPASSSSASPSAPPAAIAQNSPARSPARDDPPHVPEPASPPAVAEKPASKPPALATISPATAQPVPEDVKTAELEESLPSLIVVMIEPERCWWCWWLILAASALVAFLLGFLVYRRRRARQDQIDGWVPAWEVPRSPGRR